MPRWLLFLVLSLFAFRASAQDEAVPVFQPEPKPMPAALQMESDLRLEYYFSSLTQGGLGLLRLIGDGIVDARATFQHKHFPFFYVAGDAWYAIILANIDSVPGRHQLLVHAQGDTGALTFHRLLRVKPGNFIVQEFELTGVAAEMASSISEDLSVGSIRSVIEEFIAAPQWDARGFELPLDSELTSPFGTFRVLNGGFRTRHMGWDQNAPEGTPIRAMASGIVAAVYDIGYHRFQIYGKFVMIDHGYSVFTNYAHLSEALVERGQRVEAGQIIGLSGNTGRSSGPHLHWEILLRGEWVDGLTFLDLWLPAPSASITAAKAQQ